MAEGKKSFLMYADQIEVFNKLPDAKAGKLIKYIFDYVNDLNPTEPSDKLLQVALAPIKSQLKRDLKDWEASKKERSDSGRVGNLKRWHKDLFDRFKTGEITIEEAENIAKNRIAIGSDTGAIAKIAVNGNVNVNGNVDVYDGRQQKLFEMLSMATMGCNYEEGFLRHQVNLFLNKYPQCIAAQMGGAINSWAARINSEEVRKWKNQRDSKTGKRQVAI